MKATADEGLIAAVLEHLAAAAGPWEFIPEVEGTTAAERLTAAEILLGRGWVHADAAQKGDGRLYSVRNLSVTPGGRRALEDLRRPRHAPESSAEPLPLEEKRRRRALFMNVLYDHTDGHELELVDSHELGHALGWTPEQTDRITEYLEKEGLLAYQAMGGVIGITHYGVREVEEGRLSPGEPTEHFAPLNVVHVQGDIVGSQLQVGSEGTTQLMSNEDVLQSAEVKAFLFEFRRQISNLPLDDEARAICEADLSTAESQLASPKPKFSILREALHSLRAIAENLAASGAFVGLVDLAHHLPH